jgi:drug/metabolite transporter (DMT)-like permease
VQSGNLRAIAAMLGAVGSFAVMDALLKQLSGHYSPQQVTCIRALASLPFVLAPIAWLDAWHELRPRNLKLHLLRGALGVLMLVTFVYALQRLSLADAYAIYMAAPLLVVALSMPMFGDRVPARRWLAIACGFAGVLVVLRPTGGGLTTLGGLIAAVSAFCYALNVLTIRVLGRTDSSRSMVVWYLGLMAAGAGLWAWPSWEPVAREHWPTIAAIGLTGASGQFLFTVAFRRAQPAVVIPFEYTAILWAIGLDFALWGTLPTPFVITGAALVVAAGLYVVWDERRETVARDAVASGPGASGTAN